MASVLRSSGSPYASSLGQPTEPRGSEAHTFGSRVGTELVPPIAPMCDDWEERRDAEAGVGRLATSLLELELRAGGASEKLIDAVLAELT